MALLLSPASLVWVILMLATCISTWWLPKDAIPAEAAVAFILLIAAIKVRLVLNHFMELARAPLQWRLPFEAWVVVSTAVILGVYLQTAANSGAQVSQGREPPAMTPAVERSTESR